MRFGAADRPGTVAVNPSMLRRGLTAGCDCVVTATGAVFTTGG